MTIRIATKDDRTGIVRLLREAHEAAPDIPVPFSAPHAMALADRHIASEYMLAVVCGSDMPRGVLLASAQQHPFGGALYAMETVWWVSPDHRGRSAIAMLDAYEAWAAEMDCAFCQMAALVTFPAAARIYERRGYKPIETHYLKPLAG